MSVHRKAQLDTGKCQQCNPCQAMLACPYQIITQESKSHSKPQMPKFNKLKCSGCARCVPACPYQAVTWKLKY